MFWLQILTPLKMTEQNMKKQYDKFIELGLTEKAKAISDIPRYAHFAKKEEIKEVKSKGKK